MHLKILKKSRLKNWSMPTKVLLEFVYDFTLFFETSLTLISPTVLARKICCLSFVLAHFLESLRLQVVKLMLHGLHHQCIISRFDRLI